MKLHKHSLQFIKDLCIIKMNAERRNDKVALEHLFDLYPELFTAEFMIDLLRNTFENVMAAEDTIIPFKPYITRMH